MSASICRCGDCVNDLLPSLSFPHYTPYACEVCAKEVHGVGLPGGLCWDCRATVNFWSGMIALGWAIGIGVKPVPFFVPEMGDANVSELADGRSRRGTNRRAARTGGGEHEVGSRSRSRDNSAGHDEPDERYRNVAVGFGIGRETDPGAKTVAGEGGGRAVSGMGPIGPVTEELGKGVDRRVWTSRELARLREYRAAALTRRDIARRLGRSVESVMGAIQTYGIPKGRNREEGTR